MPHTNTAEKAMTFWGPGSSREAVLDQVSSKAHGSSLTMYPWWTKEMNYFSLKQKK